MFLVVAMKSRSFSSFSYFADEQGCRSWEGAQPGREPKLASGNIPCHGHHAQFRNGGWLGGREFSALLVFREFKSFLVQECELFWEFTLFQDLCKFCKGCEFLITARGLTANWPSSGDKIVLCIVCFTYS